MHIHYSKVALTLSALLCIGCTAKKPSFEKPTIIYKTPVTHSSYTSSSIPSSVASSLSTSSSTVQRSSSSSVSSVLPESVLIEVPFSPQSPFAKWDALHEEACEEMSLIMVQRFLGQQLLSQNDAETEVQALIAWEREHGYADDVTVSELGGIAEDYYQLHARVLTNVTADSLRRELAKGNPVIIPAGGRQLHNPNFSGEGPFYHMLVVIGYTRDGFITNDPGTKMGEQYWYATDVLMDALHDWTGEKEKIAQGPKNALVLE